jgi:Mannosylglycerate hydrolase MGH1-like glycoside hydrolase domain
MNAERERMREAGRPEEGLERASPWYRWGPYLSERAWGTVREDYSPSGDAWSYFPHDHSRSRAYRRGEDGMAGVSDVFSRLCLSLALWNGQDPILKERMFGLTNGEGNHGEDVKEYWWYLDATPSGSWMRWRYHYPQGPFPYEDLIAENARRGRDDAEYELLDTGIFDDDRYWIVEVHYAKAEPDDLLMRVVVRNRGPESATLHVLPTLWFRNTWSWDTDGVRPALRADEAGTVIHADHDELGSHTLHVGPAPDGSQPDLLFCDNDTNTARLFGETDGPAYPKDGINDHVVDGAATVNPAQTGTKAAAWYRLDVPAGGTAEVRLRLRADAPIAATTAALGPAEPDPLGDAFAAVMIEREAEADVFYADLRRPAATDEEARIMRQAFAGMLWSKQSYFYNVSRWLDGDPASPSPDPGRGTGRNAAWRHFDAADILSMPDKWEYPWFAAWDLAFHTVALAHLDPAFAKYQLLVLCREWFQHPAGALPAYEWNFDDVNPPVHAWAALRVWEIDGRRDHQFLERIFHKLLMNFTWWLNRQDLEGNDLFGGGFLGLDNIGAFDRSHLPAGSRLEQSDATAWMSFYAISMLRIALTLAESDPTYEDMTTTFLEHAVRITVAMNRRGLWDDDDGFFYDSLRMPDGRTIPLKVHSMVGVIPMLPAVIVPESVVQRSMELGKHFARFVANLGISPERAREGGFVTGQVGTRRAVFSVLAPVRLERVLTELLDEDAFLSPHGLRAVSRRHRDEPFRLDLDGVISIVDYEPGESTSGLFGGNSNWRGPVWFPLNYLVIESLHQWDDWFGQDFTVEYPSGSGARVRLIDVAGDLARRLIAIWLPDADGRRPVYGEIERFQTDPEWRDLLLFHEYFHGDTGAGIGAAHQTGWTGIVAHLLCRGGILEQLETGATTPNRTPPGAQAAPLTRPTRQVVS